jgi:hypothetical protein
MNIIEPIGHFRTTPHHFGALSILVAPVPSCLFSGRKTLEEKAAFFEENSPRKRANQENRIPPSGLSVPPSFPFVPTLLSRASPLFRRWAGGEGLYFYKMPVLQTFVFLLQYTYLSLDEANVKRTCCEAFAKINRQRVCLCELSGFSLFPLLERTILLWSKRGEEGGYTVQGKGAL